MRNEVEWALCFLIEAVTNGEWKHNDEATIRQAQMYLSGVKGVAIADVTLQAVGMACDIARHEDTRVD